MKQPLRETKISEWLFYVPCYTNDTFSLLFLNFIVIDKKTTDKKLMVQFPFGHFIRQIRDKHSQQLLDIMKKH